MIVASMIEMVTSARLGALAPLGMAISEERSESLRERRPIARVDVDIGAHSRPQRMVLRDVLDLEPHRQTLHHLHPIASRVLRRQHRELLAGARAEAEDTRFEGGAGISIDGDLSFVARPHMREL